MIIYIHGFASSGTATKAGILRDQFGEDQVLSPTLAIDPKIAIEQLIELIGQQEKPPFLVGSSLGGFYAIYLADKFGLKAALINPAVEAQTRLEEAIGFHTNFKTEQEFEFKRSYLNTLTELYVVKPECSHFLLFLQKDDDVLDYHQALEHLPTAKVVIKTGGGHQYQGFVGEMEKLKNFFELN